MDSANRKTDIEDVSDDSGLSNEEKIMEALKQNWTHGRHVEDLRVRLATFYVAVMIGSGIAVLSNQVLLIKLVGFFIGILVTLICWSMTHKWNIEFSNQIKKADYCARTLIMKTNTKKQLHEYIGFPIRDKNLPWLSVRLLYHFLYGGFFLAWILAGFSRLQDVP